MLEIRDLDAGYDRKNVLESFSASFSPGVLNVIIGPNGSGKTTLLHCTGGWMKPYGGTVCLNGKDLSSCRPSELASLTGRIESNLQAESLTVQELALLGRYHLKSWPVVYDQADLQAVNKALETMQIADLSERRIGSLSAGQKQKAAISQVLVQDPDVLLLDEPGSALDPQAKFELMDLLVTLKSPERILLCVLHDLDLALRYADRIVMLDQGRKVFDGTPEELVESGGLEAVFSLRVAEFDPKTKTGRIFPTGRNQ